jgi:hypothetical protein
MPNCSRPQQFRTIHFVWNTGISRLFHIEVFKYKRPIRSSSSHPRPIQSRFITISKIVLDYYYLSYCFNLKKSLLRPDLNPVQARNLFRRRESVECKTDFGEWP